MPTSIDIDDELSVAQENAKNLYSPEFIPYYLDVVQEFELTPIEGVVYGFIRFYTAKGREFYFSSKDLADILQLKSGTVDNCVAKLKLKKLIITDNRIKAGGGTRRFIKWVYRPNPTSRSDLIKELGQTSLPSEIYNKENNNKQNNINKKITISKDIVTKMPMVEPIVNFINPEQQKAYDEFTSREKVNWHKSNIPKKLYADVMGVWVLYKRLIRPSSVINKPTIAKIIKLFTEHDYTLEKVEHNIKRVTQNIWYSDKALQWTPDMFFRNKEGKFDSYGILPSDKPSKKDELNKQWPDLSARVRAVWIKENYPEYKMSTLPDHLDDEFWDLYNNNTIDDGIYDRIDTSLV